MILILQICKLPLWPGDRHRKVLYQENMKSKSVNLSYGHFLKVISLELFLDTASIDIDTEGDADNVTIYDT